MPVMETDIGRQTRTVRCGSRLRRKPAATRAVAVFDGPPRLHGRIARLNTIASAAWFDTPAKPVIPAGFERNRAGGHMPRMAIGDCSLYVERHGTGYPVVMISGLSGLGAYWEPQLSAFSRSFATVLHDHRGKYIPCASNSWFN